MYDAQQAVWDDLTYYFVIQEEDARLSLSGHAAFGGRSPRALARDFSCNVCTRAAASQHQQKRSNRLKRCWVRQLLVYASHPAWRRALL
jgi:hypothetical protein